MSQSGLKLLLDMDDFVVLDKPSGWTTHASSQDLPGLAEIYSEALHQKLYLIHRLDRDTSGLIVMGKTPAAAERWSEQFRKHQIQKKYLFITDRSVDFVETTHQSQISTQGKINISHPDSSSPNSETSFKRLKRTPFYTLWEARPKTGKTHQIRLHAKDLGIPILGDTLYSGTLFPRLCLHAQELTCDELHFVSHPPPFFDRMGLLKDIALVQDLALIDNRQRIFKFLQNKSECFRLIHTEKSDYRLDVFGNLLWVYWYKDHDPTPSDLKRFDFLASFLDRSWTLRLMKNRGSDPNSKIDWGPPAPKTWQAEENNLKYELRSDQGLSPGLFLDQKNNRKWVQENSINKTVLNLFAYTGGFSLNAARGGAKQVTTVDLSKNFIEWSKTNFQLNNLQTENHKFHAMDTFEYLQYAKKKNLRFDLVICDPPSFSRGPKGVFRIEKDFERLLQQMKDALAPQGRLLFSTNFEGLGVEDLIGKAKKVLPKSDVKPMLHSWDFESVPNRALMKSILITTN